MRIRSGRVVVALGALASLVLVPAAASAECNGPGCGPAPVVEGAATAITFAIVLLSAAILAVAEFRHR